jgi:hypothetical protein
LNKELKICRSDLDESLDKSTGTINLTMTGYQASGQLDLKDADGYVTISSNQPLSAYADRYG